MAEHKKQANMNVFQLPFYELKKWRNSVSRVTIVVMHVVLHTFFLFIQARRTREWAVKMIIATRVRCRGKLCVCFFLCAPGKLFPLTLVRRRVHLTARSSSLVSIYIHAAQLESNFCGARHGARGNNRNNYFHFPWVVLATSNGPRNYNVQINISAGHNILLPVK
jgi:hypothetical protein